MSKNLNIKNADTKTKKLFGSKRRDKNIPATSSITTSCGSLSFQKILTFFMRRKDITRTKKLIDISKNLFPDIKEKYKIPEISDATVP
jgi:hypothetical protein